MRTVEEWIGANDDNPPPPRVRLRVWDRFKGLCGQCGRQIRAGEKWTLEHIIALINGGLNRESNLGLTCCNCLPGKNAADVAEKSAIADKRKKHILSKEPSRGFRVPPGWKYSWKTGRMERTV